MIESVFLELSLIIIFAAGVSVIMKALKQPFIIGYIITGILVGPYVLNVVGPTELVSILSQFGVLFLLFIAGLSLNPSVIRKVGKVSLITGIGQVLFTTVIGFLIAKLLGFSDIASIYVAVALTFSSTIIIVKLLSDKGDLNTLYGRISISFLIVQDVIAIIILMLVSSAAGGGVAAYSGIEAVFVLGALVVIVVFGVFALPKLINIFSKSQELLLLFALAWLFFMSLVFGYMFSAEIGALLAGIFLSVSPHQHEIKTRMNVLRDFFIMFFFVLLGSQMVFINISQYLLPIVIFTIFILVGNPIIVMLLMGSLNYTKRNGFLSGLTVAQISEFSLILVALGVKLGHVSTEILSMVTAIGLTTIFGSTYMIMNSNSIYSRFSKHLGFFEKKGRKIDEHAYHKGKNYDVILFGYNRLGFSLLEQIKKLKKRFLVVDYDPEVIIGLSKDGQECRYGDANDSEFLNDLNFSKAKMVVSTIPDTDTNARIIKRARKKNRKMVIIVVAHQIDDAIRLYKEGAAYVVMPYFLGGQYASALIEKHGMNLDKFLREKKEHMRHLDLRSRMKHEHPKAEEHG